MSRAVKPLDLSHTTRQPQIQNLNPIVVEPPSPGFCTTHHATPKPDSPVNGIIVQPFPSD